MYDKLAFSIRPQPIIRYLTKRTFYQECINGVNHHTILCHKKDNCTV